jgi:hypothetical protein
VDRNISLSRKGGNLDALPGAEDALLRGPGFGLGLGRRSLFTFRGLGGFRRAAEGQGGKIAEEIIQITAREEKGKGEKQREEEGKKAVFTHGDLLILFLIGSKKLKNERKLSQRERSSAKDEGTEKRSGKEERRKYSDGRRELYLGR